MDFIQQILLINSSLAVFLVGVLVEIFFFIPSSLTFLAAGFLLLSPSLTWSAALVISILRIAFWGALGITSGTFLIYLIFYWGGRPFLEKFGHYFGVRSESLVNFENKFNQGYADELILFFLRAIPIWAVSIFSALSGLIRLPYKEFLIFTFLGVFLRIIILVILGWQLGGAYKIFAGKLELLNFYGTILLALFVAPVFIYVYRKFNK